MTFLAAVAVLIGAGLGALMRWSMGAAPNPIFPTLPPGTLVGDLPAEVGLVVSDEQADRFLAHLAKEPLDLVEIRVPVDSAFTNGDDR